MWLVTTILDSVATISHVTLHPDEGIKINNSTPNCVFHLYSSLEFWEELHYTQTFICFRVSAENNHIICQLLHLENQELEVSSPLLWSLRLRITFF